MGRFIFLLLILFLMITVKAYAYDDGDFQVWNTEMEEFKINKSSKVTLEQELRFGNDASELYYQHYDGGYVYDFNKHFSLGLNYRQIYDRKTSRDRFRIENRPHINAIAKYELFGFNLEDRNRLEYRHFDYQEDSWRYRNKFTIKLPWKFTPLEIRPYLADEMFLNLNGIDFNRNRFYCGFEFNIIKNLKGELFYMLQSTKSNGEWIQANVLGPRIKIVF
jgi:hypothetical protein